MTVEVVFLGTSGWYATPAGNTICTLLRADGLDVLLDAGDGLHRYAALARPGNEVFLLLSHFHLDHLIGLHGLAALPLNKLTVVGPPGAAAALATILGRPFSVPPDRLPFPISVLELPLDAGALPFAIEALPLVHADPCYGYRVTIGGKIITYCPDTGYCANAVTLARDADLLIAECAYRPGEEYPQWPHLNPEKAAAIAREAGAARLVLTHFDASRYLTVEERVDAGRHAAAVFPNSSSAVDGASMLIG